MVRGAVKFMLYKLQSSLQDLCDMMCHVLTSTANLILPGTKALWASYFCNMVKSAYLQLKNPELEHPHKQYY